MPLGYLKKVNGNIKAGLAWLWFACLGGGFGI